MKNIVESVSVVIPAFQESAAIGAVIKRIMNVVSKLGCDYEVIVIDDGSSDGTGEIARKAGARVITHPYNKGYGASLKTGIRFASNRTVVLLDADGQHDPEDIRRLVAERGTFDMVVGSRKGTAGSPLWKSVRPQPLIRRVSPVKTWSRQT